MTYLLKSKIKKLAYHIRLGSKPNDPGKVEALNRAKMELAKANPFTPKPWISFIELRKQITDAWINDGEEDDDDYNEVVEGEYSLNSEYSGEVTIDGNLSITQYLMENRIAVNLPRVTKVILKNIDFKTVFREIPKIGLPNCRNLEIVKCNLGDLANLSIFKMNRLEKLKISASKFSFKGLEDFQNLKIFDITDCILTLDLVENIAEHKSNSITELYISNPAIEPYFFADRKKFFVPKFYKQLKNNFPNLKKHDIPALRVGQYAIGEKGALSLVDNKEQGSLSLTASSIRRIAHFIRKTSSDLDRLERLLILTPDDPTLITDYVTNVVRRGSDLDVNNIAIAQEYLKQKWGIKGINLNTNILQIRGDQISDLRWMKGLNLRVRELYITLPNLTDLEGIGGLSAPNLEKLMISETKINDLRGLSNINFPGLRELFFPNNSNLTGLEGLSRINLSNIESLSFHNCSINSLKVFSGVKLPNLSRLYLEHNNISSWEGLYDLETPRLQTFKISMNPIKEAPPNNMPGRVSSIVLEGTKIPVRELRPHPSRSYTIFDSDLQVY